MDKLFKKPIKGVHVPKTELGEEKLQKIKFAAERMFVEKNFYNTSIIDICKEAGVAVGTFYIYFDDKQAIYRLLVLSYRREIKHLLAEASSKAATRRDKERDGIKAFVKYVYEKPYVYNIIWGSLSVDKQLFHDYYTSFAESYIESLTESHEVQEQIDVSTLAYTLMGITNFIGWKTIFENDYTDDKFDTLLCHVMDILEKDVFSK